MQNSSKANNPDKEVTLISILTQTLPEIGFMVEYPFMFVFTQTVLMIIRQQ